MEMWLDAPDACHYPFIRLANSNYPLSRLNHPLYPVIRLAANASAASGCPPLKTLVGTKSRVLCPPYVPKDLAGLGIVSPSSSSLAQTESPPSGFWEREGRKEGWEQRPLSDTTTSSVHSLYVNSTKGQREGLYNSFFRLLVFTSRGKASKWDRHVLRKLLLLLFFFFRFNCLWYFLLTL